MQTWNDRKFYSATPTLDTNAYGANDHMGTLISLTDILQGVGAGILESFVVVDIGKQSKGFTVFLFSASPTVASVDNAALDIADAEMSAKCLGAFSVVTADYKSVSASSVARLSPNIPLAANGKAIYAMLMADEAQTHGASDLVLKFGVRMG